MDNSHLNRRRYHPLPASQRDFKRIRYWSNHKPRTGHPWNISRRVLVSCRLHIPPHGYIQRSFGWNTSPRLRTSSEARVWELSNSSKQLQPVVRSVECFKITGGRSPSTTTIHPSDAVGSSPYSSRHPSNTVGLFRPSYATMLMFIFGTNF